MKIIIDNQNVDFEKVDVSLVYSLSSDTGVSGSFTKRTINLPRTKVNTTIFANALDLRTIQPNKNILPARIEVDGLTIFNGNCQIRGGNESTFEVDFFGNNKSWINSLKNKTFKDLVFPYIHNFTKAQIESASSNDYTQGYCYILPKCGKWAQVGFTSWNEHSPAIFVKYAIENFFSQIGYTIQSEFLNTEYFKQLIIPVTNRFYNIEYLKTRTKVHCTNPERASFSPLFVDLEWNNEIIDNAQAMGLVEFRPKIQGRYRFHTSIDGTTFQGQQGSIVAQILRNGSSNNIPRTEFVEMDLILGDIIKFRIEGNFSIDSGLLEIDYLSHTSNVQNFEINNINNNSAFVECNNLCESWSVPDFISDLQKIYNLVFFTDEGAGTIIIEPKDSWSVETTAGVESGNGFYNFETKSLDSTTDPTKSKIEFGNESERFISYSFTDADDTVKDYEKLEKIKLYSMLFDKSEQFKEGTKEVNLSFFAKCMHIQDSEVQPNSVTYVPQFPILFGSSWYQEPNQVAQYDTSIPYLLFFRGITDKGCKFKNGATVTNNYKYPIAYMVDYLENLPPKISFSPDPSSFSNFHLQELARQKNATTKTVFNFWNIFDLSNLNFKGKFLLGESLFLLKEINGFQPTFNATTKTILEKDEVVTQDIIDNLKGSELKGIIKI